MFDVRNWRWVNRGGSSIFTKVGLQVKNKNMLLLLWWKSDRGEESDKFGNFPKGGRGVATPSTLPLHPHLAVNEQAFLCTPTNTSTWTRSRKIQQLDLKKISERCTKRAIGICSFLHFVQDFICTYTCRMLWTILDWKTDSFTSFVKGAVSRNFTKFSH